MNHAKVRMIEKNRVFNPPPILVKKKKVSWNFRITEWTPQSQLDSGRWFYKPSTVI